MAITPATVHAAFGIAALGTAALTFGPALLGATTTNITTTNTQTPAFKNFQRTYMYALYDAYGFEHEQRAPAPETIAALFVAGFGSSMLFGTVAGSLADTLGRKRGALAYVVVYAASCATKHWRSYNVLMVGRVLGGVATSLLFSVFDAWLVAEHTARGFEPAWLSSTFANAQARRPASVTTSLRRLTCKTQAGNSLVAIAAGVIGEWAAGLSPMRVLVAGGDDSAVADAGGPDGAIMVGGYCAPFDLAAAVLLVGGVVILLTWSENYGERAGGADSSYAAVTPPGGEKPPYGEIFSVMMICCMAGTRLFGFLVERDPPEKFSRGLFAVAACALATPVALPGRPTWALAGFLAFELVVGAYFPAMGTLKSKIIPDAQRATIYNLFRVPLNVIVLLVLLSHLDTVQVFTAVVALLAAAAALQHALYVATVDYSKRVVAVESDKEPLVAV
ncbi:Major Facilitator superfamily [Aureococcus anophagefferens]|uniref:Molybdate-anion transporter n=1 Tax=Aureococcus anophagefferens TaxID=44056 RepID=A0ABR1FK40_AURAN